MHALIDFDIVYCVIIIRHRAAGGWLVVGHQEQKCRRPDHEQQKRQRMSTKRRDDRRDRAKYRAENVEFIHVCSNLGLDRKHGNISLRA